MRVLVTRPGDVALRTRQRLQAAGHEVVLLPLFECVPERNIADLVPSERAGLILTSANGALAAGVLAGRDEPVYAVGTATAAAARAAGFGDLRVGEGTAADLSRRIVADIDEGRLRPAPSRPLVYVAGRERRPDLEERLGSAGVALRVVIGYHMQEISYSTDFLLKDKLSPPIDAILLYSANAARRFSALAGDKSLAGAFDRSVALCLSRAVADGLGSTWRGRYRIAEAPTEAALLASVEALR